MKITHLSKAAIIASVGMLMCSSSVFAAVSADEAAKLKTTLTPLGGEKAGNAEGTIPAWDGGLVTKDPVKDIYQFTDPFANEKPLFTITAANMDQYKDKLTEGSIELLKRFPDYHINVYKTHRTLAAPQAVYDNTFKNATTATMAGLVPKGAWGGTPFPIPQTAEEVMWNNNLHYNLPDNIEAGHGYMITGSGDLVSLNASDVAFAYPYFNKDDGDADTIYWKLRIDQTAPPIRAGEAVLSHFAYDSNNDMSWLYLTGQRRVRRLPNGCCDTPFPAAGGVLGFDETYVWSGRLDRYDWKIAGKKEIYIPYNSNMSVAGDKHEANMKFMGKQHVNPDMVRYELHRVWVIDATVKSGARHTAPKARFYVDEDSWIAMLGERWDASGNLWKIGFNQPVVLPNVPGTTTLGFGFQDLTSGTQIYLAMIESPAGGPLIKWVDKYPTGYFTQDALAGEGVR